jgi:hypothetical protein
MRISLNTAGDSPRSRAGLGLHALALLAGVAVCLAGTLPGAAAAEGPVSKENQVKAAFIFNFLKFVEWPAGKFQDINSPMVIGVAGKGPIRAALDEAVKGRKLNGRELIVKTVEAPEDAKAVHLLFVNATEDSRLDVLLPACESASVLSVGESELFGKRGGMILFTLEGDKLRFEINMDAATAAKLNVSAQLQKLARSIRRKS